MYKLRFHFQDSSTSPEEISIIFNAIYQLKFSELLPHDQKLFLSLSRDIFPELRAESPVFDELKEAMEAVCEKRYLDCHPYFMEKVQQLYQMIR